MSTMDELLEGIRREAGLVEAKATREEKLAAWRAGARERAPGVVRAIRRHLAGMESWSGSRSLGSAIVSKAGAKPAFQLVSDGRGWEADHRGVQQLRHPAVAHLTDLDRYLHHQDFAESPTGGAFGYLRFNRDGVVYYSEAIGGRGGPLVVSVWGPGDADPPTVARRLGASAGSVEDTLRAWIPGSKKRPWRT